MPTDPTPAESLARLLYWVGGVATTIAGSWVASKIRVYHDNRKLHLEDLKQKLLGPLRDALRASYGDLVASRGSAVTSGWGRLEVRTAAQVTEETERHGPLLQRSDPREQVELAMDRALLEDARRNHYRETIARWEGFRDAWTEHAKGSESWVGALSEEILAASDLPALSAGLRHDQPYIMHLALGWYIYARTIGIPTSPLRAASTGQTQQYAISSSSTTLALGSAEQMNAVLRRLDQLVDRERGRADGLRSELGKLRAQLAGLLDELSFALASRRLRGPCRLVPFF